MARSLTSTTLSVAIPNTSEQYLTLASMTGVELGDLIVVDDEAMSVIALTPAFKVQRGVAGTKTSTHASGAKVWHGQPTDFSNSRKSGTGDAALELVLPRVVLGSDGVTVQDLRNGVWYTIEQNLPESESDFGTVTQITSITTGVTIHKRAGQITTVSQTIGTAAEADFTVTNDRVRAGDVVVVCIGTHTSAGTFQATVAAVANGSFVVRLANLHASAAGDGVLVLNFRVLSQGAPS